jgi:ferredoxin/flavodoxin---NADP+ reductase
MIVTAQTHQKAEITWRKDVAADLWSIRIRPQHPVPFIAGQYATLGMVLDEQVIERPYSIVSSPLEDEMEFFFELVPHGGLTPYIHHMKLGDTLLVRCQAKGLFTLDSKSGHKRHFMVSTVTGVAPYVSIVRTLVRESETGKPVEHEVIMLDAASRSWELAYQGELAAFARRFGWLHYIPTVSRPWEDSSWEGELGRAEDVLRKYLDRFKLGPADTTVYLCGHSEMIKKAEGILMRRGFPSVSIRKEIYWVPRKTYIPE